MKVGIAGVGGIGSNVAVNLVRAGWHDLKLVDMDRIETANLNRQFYFADQIGCYKVEALRENLLRIDPSARIETLVLRLDGHNIIRTFANCGVIVEGFDNERTKKLLIESFAERNTPVVSACGIAGYGLSEVRTKRIGNCEVIGDFSSDFREQGLYCPKIQIIAAMMADQVLQKIRSER